MSEKTDAPIIFCELRKETRETILAYAEALKESAPLIGQHGLGWQEFWDSGIFNSAIEHLRGSRSASMSTKRLFIEAALNRMSELGEVEDWRFTGSGERHDYEITLPGGWRSVVETKGCLDGNNTNIFERPPHADEFIIWSLCQNPGSNPRKNAWSGIHTRLSAEVMHKGQRVDGLVIWDMLCGATGRPCPKLEDEGRSAFDYGERKVPPPCLYLFPRSIPDPRNNPEPSCWRLGDVRLLQAMHRAFGGDDNDVVEVHIEARMDDADVQRRTRFVRGGREFMTSNWTTLRRARR